MYRELVKTWNNLPGNTSFGSLNQFKGSIDNINLEDYLVMQYD